MSVIIPECTSCKNFTEKNKEGLFCCTAFPDGIPDEYFWCKIDVIKIPECADGIRYEKVSD